MPTSRHDQTTLFNLNGGTAVIGNFVSSDGANGTHQSHINFNGGVLLPTPVIRRLVLSALPGGLTAAVNLGGAVINPNGYGITIAARSFMAAAPWMAV